jgi:hypothetical protein
LGLLLLAAVVGIPLTFVDGGKGNAAAIGYLVLVTIGGAGVILLLLEAFVPKKD